MLSINFYLFWSLDDREFLKQVVELIFLCVLKPADFVYQSVMPH